MPLPHASPLHWLQVGAELAVWEWVPMLVLPGALFLAPAALHHVFLVNLRRQLALFAVVCQLPVLVTGHMTYVDIAWPSGLVVLAYTCFVEGTAPLARRACVCGALGLHGGRMTLGALALFGWETKWTYRFSEDLARYRFARERWVAAGMPPSLWWLKQQHDTLQQAFVNACVLFTPIALVACYDDAGARAPCALELAGLVLWGHAWAWENLADVQKLLFVERVRAVPRAARGATLPVLGAGGPCDAFPGGGPLDGPFCLWRLCRHPNYFGEWCCWLGFVVASLPALAALECGAPVRAALAVLDVSVVRFMYDCLVHWTGAGPAEHFSARRRGAPYHEYQRTTRCFFPFEMPGVDHHRTPGWPSLEDSSAAAPTSKSDDDASSLLPTLV